MERLSKGECLANFRDLVEEVSVTENLASTEQGGNGFPALNVVLESGESPLSLARMALDEPPTPEVFTYFAFDFLDRRIFYNEMFFVE